MLRRVISRSYWYKGAPGYSEYKTGFLDKRAQWPYNDLDDPLSKNATPGHVRMHDTPISGEKVASDYLLKHPSISLSGNALGFLAYRCSRFPEHDPVLWDLLEYHLEKLVSAMGPRVLYGCYYGFLRTGKVAPLNFNLLHKEFVTRVSPKINTFECFEIIEASALSPRRNYDPRPFLLDDIVPKVNHFWKNARCFRQLPTLKKTVHSLEKLSLYKEIPELWTNLMGIFENQKTISNLVKWTGFYEMLVSLRSAGFEEKTGMSLDGLFAKYQAFWSANPDFQWRYNLAAGRLFTASEMVARAATSPLAPSWQEAEPSILHHLPQWYLDGDKEVDDDLKTMMMEYYVNTGELAMTQKDGRKMSTKTFDMSEFMQAEEQEKPEGEEGESGEEGELGEEGEAAGEGQEGQEEDVSAPPPKKETAVKKDSSGKKDPSGKKKKKPKAEEE